ncbi:hypothetical protein [Deinococcus peraridilitoris]|uniref:Uncharacterized protein n=1 Tax=Deinococcus peraridilitoris (strain DSM 19664 / LMG 22246 / CIP 109416 / KR-200) TaxID=937777 RepID=L0A2X5_DEIPD|nr:hypothetical protein [Deinococcus peraridilitoris]AFZ68186.1 hypothetical protein Deipe_2721 [Deinococcus peraridilitoris DSM 19664]
MDVIVETIPNGAQNEHVVLESPLAWLPQGARVLIEPGRGEGTEGEYDNHLVFEGQHHHIRNVRVIDGHQPDRTRTAFEVVEH